MVFALGGFRAWLLFLEKRFGDYIFFRCPIAQITQPAAVAAEREIGVCRRIHGLTADGAIMLHRAISIANDSILRLDSPSPRRYLTSGQLDIRPKGGRYASMRRGVPVGICRSEKPGSPAGALFTDSHI